MKRRDFMKMATGAAVGMSLPWALPAEEPQADRNRSEAPENGAFGPRMFAGELARNAAAAD